MDMYMYKFDKVISLWKMEACLSEPVMYDVNYDTREILIYTTRPGWLIGKAGCLVNKYTEVMKKEWPIFNGFRFKETRNWVY